MQHAGTTRANMVSTLAEVREMFEQSLIAEAVKRQSPWSFAASLSLQSILVAAAMSIPMMYVGKIDMKLADVVFLPRQIGKPELQQQPVKRSVTSSTILENTSGRTYKPFTAPTSIPKQVATGPDLPNAPVYDFGGHSATGAGSGGVATIGLPGLFDDGTKLVAIAPPVAIPKPPAAAAESKPLRIGEGVQAAKIIYAPKPVYPPLARQARISGPVHLAAEISPDGHIRNLRVLSGHPMLTQAAIDAVKQWTYHPTLLNGQPFEVVTEVTVNFILNN
jgi:protein TonB